MLTMNDEQYSRSSQTTSLLIPAFSFIAQNSSLNIMISIWLKKTKFQNRRAYRGSSRTRTPSSKLYSFEHILWLVLLSNPLWLLEVLLPPSEKVRVLVSRRRVWLRRIAYVWTGNKNAAFLWWMYEKRVINFGYRGNDETANFHAVVLDQSGKRTGDKWTDIAFY
jgi:hypothetical protein